MTLTSSSESTPSWIVARKLRQRLTSTIRFDSTGREGEGPQAERRPAVGPVSEGERPAPAISNHREVNGRLAKPLVGWTIRPISEASSDHCVPHRAHLRPELCSQELRLDPVYMLPIRVEAVVFEWPDPVTSASTSAATTPSNTPNKKPKIELPVLTDF